MPDDRDDELLLPGGKIDPEALRRAWDEASDDERPGRVRLELRKDVETRLDKYLVSRITFLSRTRLQRLIETGAAWVNGRQARASSKLRRGDVIEVDLPAPPSREIRAEQIPLEVLYEDRHLVVLNKQRDIIVHPARGEQSGTLINALAWHFASVSEGALSRVGEDLARPGVVHRLDRNTTGCIVFAKDDEAHWKLGAQFERREVDKRYLALVHGAVEPEVQVLDMPLGPHPSREKGYREKYVVRYDELGKPSVTICRVRERFARPARPGGARDRPERHTLVELELKTGRTHQIRVHLSHMLWPIAGDEMYGGGGICDREGQERAPRVMLHAAMLAFRHPITGEALSFAAPLPGDIRGALDVLRREGEHEPLCPPGATLNERHGLLPPTSGHA